MSFFLGLAGGAMIATTVWVAFMAPKHWDWYQENKRLERALRVAAEERDHYKQMSYPSEWGTVEQHEAGIKPNEVRPWDSFEDLRDATLQDHKHEDDIEYTFDDIRDGGD